MSWRSDATSTGHQAGYTLLEALIVLALAELIFAVAVPSAFGLLSRADRREDLINQLAIIRQRAIDQARSITVVTTPGEETALRALGLEAVRLEGVRWLPSQGSADSKAMPLVFFPDGTAAPGVLIADGSLGRWSLNADPWSGRFTLEHGNVQK